MRLRSSGRAIGATKKDLCVMSDSNVSPIHGIKKPSAFDLSSFKSKRKTPDGVETLVTGLPVMKLSEAKDFARLHPSEADYWSDELCFVNVPIKGQKRDTLHLINEELAVANLQPGLIIRHRLALASKPLDTFFLCVVPSQNIDNDWNKSALQGCEQAKTLWTQAVSQKDKGIESYAITKARDNDAFPEPNWPPQSLDELIIRTFDGRMIMAEDHAALARLTGSKLSFT
jgi:hypothetical protein